MPENTYFLLSFLCVTFDPEVKMECGLKFRRKKCRGTVRGSEHPRMLLVKQSEAMLIGRCQNSETFFLSLCLFLLCLKTLSRVSGRRSFDWQLSTPALTFGIGRQEKEGKGHGWMTGVKERTFFNGVCGWSSWWPLNLSVLWSAGIFSPFRSHATLSFKLAKKKNKSKS